MPDTNATSVSDENESVIPAPVHPPVVRTLSPVEESNGTLRLQGKVMTQGSSPVTEVGFLLSPFLSLDSQNPDVIRLEGFLDQDTFGAGRETAELGNVFYYQAFARNAAGESVGSKRRFVQRETDTPRWIINAEDVGNGWLHSPWFGNFYETRTPWLFHAELGWLYAVDDGTGNGWFWREGQGWLWTGKGLYPHLYRHHDQAWLYFLKRKNGKARFYNYATGKVE